MGSGRTRSLGDQAERTALEFLVGKHLSLVCKNYRRRGGEIDLIMLHDDCLAFVEVRYRSSTRYASPELSIDTRKQRKIMRTAALFLAETRHFAEHTVRFDVIAISAGKQPRIHWIRDAFRPQDSTL